MNETQIANLAEVLRNILEILKKIEKNTQPETIEETRNRILGFGNEI